MLYTIIAKIPSVINSVLTVESIVDARSVAYGLMAEKFRPPG